MFYPIQSTKPIGEKKKAKLTGNNMLYAYSLFTRLHFKSVFTCDTVTYAGVSEVSGSTYLPFVRVGK